VFPRYQTQEVISNNVTATVIIQGIFLYCRADVDEGTQGLTFEVIITTTRFTLSSSRLWLAGGY